MRILWGHVYLQKYLTLDTRMVFYKYLGVHQLHFFSTFQSFPHLWFGSVELESSSFYYAQIELEIVFFYITCSKGSKDENGPICDGDFVEQNNFSSLVTSDEEMMKSGTKRLCTRSWCHGNHTESLSMYFMCIFKFHFFSRHIYLKCIFGSRCKRYLLG